MCGFAGIWGAADEKAVGRMLTRLAHRGPDATGLHVQSQAALGHRRLSIMDPAGGDQPLYNERHSSVLVSNGEIYNFPQLRDALRARHTFATSSDSEVVLHLYEDRRTEAVKALDGMFAFALLDGEELFLARDPLGIKPLYYGNLPTAGSQSALTFASELKAFPANASEVKEFPPGTTYDSRAGFRQYYTLPNRPPRAAAPDAQAAHLRRVLEAAVEKRLMSDVPLGAFLSGGLDSSVIVALARQHMPELHTFSVGLEGSRDLEAARTVARHLDTIHHEYVYTAQEILAHLPEVLYHLESFDADLVRSAIPTFFCSRLAAQHVKVILTGEGADELFAGYTYHKSIAEPDALHEELRRSVGALHNVNLQRVDRLTMAHGLEGRVPFLDLTMVEAGQALAPELKLRAARPQQRIEKWILRKACEDLLPGEIVWRDKEQFDEGSGTVDALAQVLREAAGDLDFEAYRDR
ncbi:MAG: asparagine synthase B, partial [Dehalococcoidia bacterium]